MGQIAFSPSSPRTLGVELELQLIHPDTFDLTPAAPSVIDGLKDHPHAEHFKPEITRAMIELNSGVHDDALALQSELRVLRDAVCAAARDAGACIAGGGTHPFMRWQDRRISAQPRFEHVAGRFGYLAPKFTVFGQHIHLGVSSGDEAIALIRRLMPYVPHLLAISASSPFHEGVDTQFASSRPHALHGFPLAGFMPETIRDWYGFESHILWLQQLGLIDDLKEIYWDIRPKPEFGTIEIRVCDSPLSIDRASQLAAFARVLAVCVAGDPDPEPAAWLSYRANHFEACRFGLRAAYRAPDGRTLCLQDHLDELFTRLIPVADQLSLGDMLGALRSSLARQGNDARWLRECLQRSGSFPGVVARAVEVFHGD